MLNISFSASELKTPCVIVLLPSDSDSCAPSKTAAGGGKRASRQTVDTYLKKMKKNQALYRTCRADAACPEDGQRHEKQTGSVLSAPGAAVFPAGGDEEVDGNRWDYSQADTERYLAARAEQRCKNCEQIRPHLKSGSSCSQASTCSRIYGWI